MSNISKDQWISLLKSTAFFKAFEDHEINKIVENADLLHFKMHQYIIKENEEDFSFFVIIKGHANVINKTQSSSPPEQLLTINAGECFGEMAVITKQTRTNFVIAGSECYVMKVNGATIDNFDESIQLKLYKQFSLILTKRLQSSFSPS